MEDIKNKNEHQVENKIFTKSDLSDFLRLFIQQSYEILEKAKEIRRQNLIREGWTEKKISEEYVNMSHSGITMTSSENLHYTFTFEQIADAIKSLDEILITEVELHFNEKISDCRLSARLIHSGSSPGSSYIMAEGTDSIWLNETIRIFKEFLDGCKNQFGFVRKYQIPIIITIIGLLSFFLVNFIKFFIKAEVSFPKIVSNIFNDDLVYYILIFAAVSATPAILINRWLKKLYPDVELQTGPNSEKLQKERRNKILILIFVLIGFVAVSILI
jgi:hypothetical protein